MFNASFQTSTALSLSGMPYPDEHFEFEQIIGPTVIGKKRNGTLVNGGQIVPGIVGNAIELNSANLEYVELGPIHESCFDDMDLCTEGLTLAFWTDTSDGTSQQTPIGISNGKQEDRQGVHFDMAVGLAIIAVRFSDELQIALYSINPPTGWLHHGLIIKKGQHVQYTLNGTLLSPLSTSIDTSSGTLGGTVRFGNVAEEITNQPFMGRLDDIRLWKQAKCPEFLKYIYDMYKK